MISTGDGAPVLEQMPENPEGQRKKKKSFKAAVRAVVAARRLHPYRAPDRVPCCISWRCILRCLRLGRGVDVVHRFPLAHGVLCVSSGSVVEFSGDVVVNAANRGCQNGGGVDGAIIRQGGYVLRKARSDLRLINLAGDRCRTGEAVITSFIRFASDRFNRILFRSEFCQVRVHQNSVRIHTFRHRPLLSESSLQL